MKYFLKDSNKGQAVVEYILVISFVGLLSIQIIKAMNNQFGPLFGELNSVVTSHLSVGVCKDFCFYDGYLNGPTPGEVE